MAGYDDIRNTPTSASQRIILPGSESVPNPTGVGASNVPLPDSLQGILQNTAAMAQAAKDTFSEIQILNQRFESFMGNSSRGSGAGDEALNVRVVNAKEMGGRGGGGGVSGLNTVGADTDEEDMSQERRERRSAARRGLHLHEGRTIGARSSTMSKHFLGQLGREREDTPDQSGVRAALSVLQGRGGLVSAGSAAYNARRAAMDAAEVSAAKELYGPFTEAHPRPSRVVGAGGGAGFRAAAGGIAREAGSLLGTLGGEAAVPGIGEIAMIATAAYEGTQFVGNYIAGQRAKNAAFQEIEGGSNIGAVAERARSKIYQMQQLGVFTGAQAEQLFMDVTKTGMTGAERMGALGFARENYLQMGMSTTDSVKFIQMAAKNSALSLNQVAGSLQALTAVARDAHVNTQAAREALQQNIAGAIGLAGGAAATSIGTTTTAYLVGMGRTVAASGVGLDVSGQTAMGRYYGALTAMGYNFPGGIGGMQAAMAKDPTLLSKAQQAVQTQIVAQSNPAAVAAMSQFAAPRNGEYRNVQMNSEMGQALLQSTPGGTEVMKQQLQAAGYTIPQGASPEAILTMYANMVSGKSTPMSTVGNRANTYAHQQAIMTGAKGNLEDYALKHGMTQAQWDRSQKGSGLFGIGGGWSAGHANNGSREDKLFAVIGQAQNYEAKYGQQAKFMVGGQAYTLADIEKNQKLLDAVYQEWADDPNSVKMAKPGKVLDGKGLTGKGKGDHATLTIGFQPGIANMLSAQVQNSPGWISIVPSPNGTSNI